MAATNRSARVIRMGAAWGPLLSLATIMLILGLCEFAARALHLAPLRFDIPRGEFRLSADPELGFELAPGTYEAGRVAISSQGLRDDREYPTEKAVGTFRVAVIGDSIAFGLELADADTFPRALETLLNESRPFAAERYEVMNFGVSGYNSHQIARRLATRVAPFRPDMVVYLYCVNDPQEFSLELAQLTMQKAAGGQWGPGQLSRLPTQLQARSHLYRLLELALRRIREGNSDELASDDPQLRAIGRGDAVGYYSSLYRSPSVWVRTQEDIAGMARLARSFNSTFIGVIVPLFDTGAGAYPLSAVHREVFAAFNAAGALVLDLAPPLGLAARSGRFKPNIDPLHLSPEGGRFAALALLNYLLAERLVAGMDAVTFRAFPWKDPGLRRLIAWL